MKTSRQYRWQLKQIALGRCARCGEKRNHYTVLCDACQVQDRVRQQQRSGCRAWQKGKPGRPPRVMLRAKRRARR
jgi:hypothetical protein